MKDIKFRVSLKEDNEFYSAHGLKANKIYDVYSINPVNKTISFMLTMKAFTSSTEPRIYSIPFADINLMQYIGKKDINNNEIYEADIIKYGHFVYYNTLKGLDTDIGIVTFNNGSFTVKHDSQERNLSEAHVIEILGNVYENPELIPHK